MKSLVKTALVVLLACSSLPGAWAAPAPSGSVVVSGAVKTVLTLKPEDLRAFPAEQISSVTLTRKIDGKEQGSTVRGVKLSAILERAGLPSGGDRNDWKRMVVLAGAVDGYRVAFSWPELINTEVGAGVLVLFERDGAALDDGEGRIALISARDLRAGPRHVKWLSQIELRLL